VQFEPGWTSSGQLGLGDTRAPAKVTPASTKLQRDATTIQKASLAFFLSQRHGIARGNPMTHLAVDCQQVPQKQGRLDLGSRDS
jgi:hypothetical protein